MEDCEKIFEEDCLKETARNLGVDSGPNGAFAAANPVREDRGKSGERGTPDSQIKHSKRGI